MPRLNRPPDPLIQAGLLVIPGGRRIAFCRHIMVALATITHFELRDGHRALGEKNVRPGPIVHAKSFVKRPWYDALQRLADRLRARGKELAQQRDVAVYA